ncbi:hypothetical protein E2C01_050329 [Portunus trituberculatus]|uniref:Uncharacterized protein n=1 Tax=Portunus trituberculatus TaxID=210409 RepID=A0A5B7G7Z3_PORTR|nr:hypothetical protein [Portunus trituberculatus]
MGTLYSHSSNSTTCALLSWWPCLIAINLRSQISYRHPMSVCSPYHEVSNITDNTIHTLSSFLIWVLHPNSSICQDISQHHINS